MVVGKRKNENIIGISNIFKKNHQIRQCKIHAIMYIQKHCIETITLFNENAVT